jgi:hypothetical protein
MLDPWIIEEIRRREEERRRDDLSQLELPMQAPEHFDEEPRQRPRKEDEDEDRGVWIMDI